jgi:hypothetical protein
MAEDKVTVDDIVELLAKHASTPSDPDDADTLARFNQQVIDARVEQESKPATATPKGRP